MNLSQAVKQIIGKYFEHYGIPDVVMAKVYSVNPISIQLLNTTQPIVITHESIKLTNAVVEKTIDVLEHKHSYFDSDTGEGASGSENRETKIALQNIQAYEYGEPLGIKTEKDGKTKRIILNKALEVGELVLVLQVKRGTDFIILSRLYDSSKIGG